MSWTVEGVARLLDTSLVLIGCGYIAAMVYQAIRRTDGSVRALLRLLADFIGL